MVFMDLPWYKRQCFHTYPSYLADGFKYSKVIGIFRPDTPETWLMVLDLQMSR
jgi:hypothetical protein